MKTKHTLFQHLAASFKPNKDYICQLLGSCQFTWDWTGIQGGSACGGFAKHNEMLQLTGCPVHEEASVHAFRRICENALNTDLNAQ